MGICAICGFTISSGALMSEYPSSFYASHCTAYYTESK